MDSKLRATMALALTLIGAGVGCAPPPEDSTKADKPPAFPKRPGQEAPARASVGGGGPRNHCEDGPATAGTSYRRHWNEDAQVWAWRKVTHSLYYRDKDGQIHAYQPGEDKARDMAFPAIAKKKGLVLIGRKERRAIHREERARYKAIVKARGQAPVTGEVG